MLNRTVGDTLMKLSHFQMATLMIAVKEIMATKFTMNVWILARMVGVVLNVAKYYSGGKMIFKIKCIGCGTVFDEEVEGEAAEVLLDAFDASGQEIMQGCCPQCRQTKNNLAINELLEGLS